MYLTLRKLFFIIIFNSSLLLLLMIAIQNSLEKKKVNLIMGETINLPLSFIIGVSFISGSTIGSLLTFKLDNKK